MALYTKSGNELVRIDLPAATKSTVGLGNVENYGIATQEQMQTTLADASNSAYTTPLRVINAIENKRRRATTDETTAGTSSNRIITPIRLKEQLNMLSAYIDDKIANL